MNRRNLEQLYKETGLIANFVRSKRKSLGYTQLVFSQRTGVGLRFLKELEQGKQSLRLDKVEQLLNYLGHTLGPVPIPKKTFILDQESE